MNARLKVKCRSHKSFLLGAIVAASLACSKSASAVASASDSIPARSGAIRITPKFHGSLQIAYAGMIIEVDPISAASYTQKADYILITHVHPDHFDPAAIKKLVKPNAATSIVAPEAIVKELRPTLKTVDFLSLKNGEMATQEEIVTGRSRRREVIRIQAVPMYNIVRGPKAGQKFHAKGAGNGYILTLGGKRIYIAGDTEATPELRRLKNIDVAFIPMNLPYTMTSQEAAQGVRAFKPKVVYPYHYRYPFNKANTNAQQFAAALKGSGIQVRLREWYPSAAVARAGG